MKKKIVAFCMCLTLALLMLPAAACGGKPKDAVNVYVPDGATALALAYFMQSDETIRDRKVNINVVPSSSISSYVTSGDADFAVVPSNLAAKLYNANGKYKLAMTLTHGNLYIVGGETADINGLVGKRVGAIGQGQVPDLVLRYILKQNNIEYVVSDTAVEGKVALKYYADGGAVAKAYLASQLDFGLLAEPAASTVSAKIESAPFMDVQKLWKDVTQMDGFPQACLVVKSDFAKTDYDFVNAFTEAIKQHDGWAQENPSATVTAIANNMIEGSESTVKSLSADIVRRCNITAIDALSDRQAVEAYLALFLDMESELDTSLIGGKLPDDNFYYDRIDGLARADA